MHGFTANIEKQTIANENFREVLYTAKHCQLVLMSLKSGEDIGQEVHDVDQFFRVEQGQGKAVLDGVEFKIADGDVVIVPAGRNHNIINTSEREPLKLYTIYSPPNHKDGTVHSTKEEAMRIDEHFDGNITEN
jgi:mannose-6-phosphate isomerase-like protein (cupin superfamily)